MSKIPKTFRLSEQAVKHLGQIVEQTGSSDTAVVEMALAHFAKVMQGQSEVSQVSVKSAPVKVVQGQVRSNPVVSSFVPEDPPFYFGDREAAPIAVNNNSGVRGDSLGQRSRKRHKSKRGEHGA